MKLCFRKGSAFASQKAKNYLKDKNPDDIKKITVIRHAAIGDFMQTRPFLIELRGYFKNAKITLSILRSTMYGLPQDLIDDVHIMDKDNPTNPLKKTGLITRIRQAKALASQDIIFDLTDSTLTALLLLFAKADLKIGYPYRAVRRLFVDMAIYRSEFVFEARSAINMLNFLGLAQVQKLNFGYDEKYQKNDNKTIIYFAGASQKNRCWSEQKFSSLIKKMSISYSDYKHVVLQGIREDEQFLDIYEPLKDIKNVVLKQPMKLDEVMQYLSDARCVIAGDTGIRNMAIAVQTPTVGIFFISAPFRYWPNDGRHECVFNSNYTNPDVKDLYNATTKLLTKLYT